MYVIHWNDMDRVNLSPTVDNLRVECLLNHSNILLLNDIWGHFDGYDVSVCFLAFIRRKFLCLRNFTSHQFGVVCAFVMDFYNKVKNRYILCRRLGGPQGQSGGARNIAPLLGFDPRTVRPVASSYTGYSIPVKFRFLYRSHLPVLVQFVKKFGFKDAHKYLFRDNGFNNKAGNVRLTWHWGACVEQLLPWKSNKY